MRISYNWLRDYLMTDMAPEKVAEILTQIGLEVESLEHQESIPGGLAGLVVGEVLTCEKHPNADKLSLTLVNIGGEVALPIVCGAPNVAPGQKVVVAPVGTVLSAAKEPFTIKKSKIRGEISEGMICAEDEIGLGDDHSGIIVLNSDAVPGTPVSELFSLENDTVFEIGLTPNRIDSASHIGVARDLRAFLNLDNQISLSLPLVDPLPAPNHSMNITVKVDDTDGCIRYSGICLSDVKVGDSPDWLKNKLLSIGMSPINNVVDITNFVLHETGQPLHAFDADKITGATVVVRKLPEGRPFMTLDGESRILHGDDLMICHSDDGMCIAGVFGGKESGVTESTQRIFLESACFNPVRIRKTARRHMLNTDSSFRFERGTDPNGTLFALKRAALLICEITGAQIASEITDVYPTPVEPYRVDLTWHNLDRLIGIQIDRDVVKQILQALDIRIVAEYQAGLQLAVATYRVDVRREADVIEEILRIYGYNNVGFREEVSSSLSYIEHPDKDKIENMVADLLTANGLHEIMCNSLTRVSYYKSRQNPDPARTVELFNPLSSDLGAMRQTLLFGGLETIAHNHKRQTQDLQLYEFGNVYRLKAGGNPLLADGYEETRMLGIWLSGHKTAEHWQYKKAESDFYQLKALVNLVLLKLGLDPEELEINPLQDDMIQTGLTGKLRNRHLVSMGMIHPKTTRDFDLEQAVWYAEMVWTEIVALSNPAVSYKEVPRFPKVRRDLALILDKTITYQNIRDLAFVVERKLLKEVTLFDLFESDKIGKDKKSMGITFILQDEAATLTDVQIDETMTRLVSAFEKKLGASLR